MRKLCCCHRCLSQRLCLIAVILAACCGALAHAAMASTPFVALPENSTTVIVLENGQPYLEVSLVGWEENWKFLGLRGNISDRGQSTHLENAAEVTSGAELTMNMQVHRSGPRQLQLDTEVRTTRDVRLVYAAAATTLAEGAFPQGRVTVSRADASVDHVDLPLGKKGLGEDVRQVSLRDAEGRTTSLRFAAPCHVPTDEAMRIVLAEGEFPSGEVARQRITIDLPADVRYYSGPEQVPYEAGFDRWYAWEPDEQYDDPGEIGMQSWLDAPAGKLGRVMRQGEKLIYGGQPVRFWGLNLCYSACAPDRELAEKRAAFYAKYGINAVRLHKYADRPGWGGIQSEDSFVELDPEGLDRMDYLIAQFKRRGIFVKLSAHFGTQKLGPGDRKYVPYLEEFGSFGGRNQRIATPHSAVHYAPELQNVQILQMVNLLKHENPYTGMTYADDPAVAFIEIINEQSILFFTSMQPLKASTTLRKHVAEKFCDWLRAKYGTHDQLVAAWGTRALDSFAGEGMTAGNEHLDRNNILPLGNPWYWDPDQLAGEQAFQKQRLLDTLQFLYQLQNQFYARYVQALRTAGYEGEILASNWQAGRALSHYCNLHSDALVGTIDRHNYFGGGSRTRINDATMLSVPGSGTLSAGMQQVADRPFMLSEWIHVSPNEWGVEGPAIIGAYGMGLQGWDVSFMFQNRDKGTFSERIGRERWDVTAPHVLGVFPAVARQVLRGDVEQAELTVPRYVHMPSVQAGKLDFEDTVAQQYDVKTFTSDKVPARSLAVGRCVVDFTDQWRPTGAFDPDRFLRDGFYQSATGQLRWKPGQSKLDGLFTINSPGTKAVVGFAEGQVCKLDTVTITPQSHYAAIYVTARDQNAAVQTADNLLVVAIARARNTNMKVFAGNRILQAGDSPVLMEPVRARIAIRRSATPTVHVLDHSGRRTGRTLPVASGQFQIDGAQDRTCYYLVTFAD